MANIVVFGAGQIADVARVYIDTHGPDRIVGFTVDKAFHTADTFADRPLVPFEELEKHFPPDQVKLLGPLSYRKLNEFRTNRYLEGKKRGYSFTSFIHPHSHVYSEKIGENCFILENNTIQPFVEIGNNVIIWSGNHIGHHTRIGDNCFVTSHNCISSNVVIEEGCFVAGVVAIDYGLTVGAQSFIGICSTIRKNLPPECVLRPRKATPSAPFSSKRMKKLL
jgi:hypothetical protein